MSRDTVAAWVGSLPPLEPSPTKERKRNPSAEERGGHGIHGEERLDEAQGERRRQCWMDSLATKSRKTTKLNRFVHRFWLKVETKKTIPRGSLQSEDFKTKKIFVGGIRSTLTEDEFKNFFSKYGKVANHRIIRDHSTNRACGFGFIIFDSEEVVDDLLSEGNMIDLAGSKELG
ncbi:uncharacterized protein LOC135622989 isoform X3 [Musa acuminata AAA Group]|uniref:uncharacterized protein LOC135622989 isoform X3 n=1 Tax=Musa acuminata AAA Group TaxID=214697 RepID=UPI0031E02ECD